MLDLSAIVRSGLRLLLVQHPRRTSIGICGGMFMSTLVDAFKALLPATVNVAAFTDFRMAIGGVFLANAPLLFRRGTLPEHIEDELATIRHAVQEGNLSATQVRLLYIRVCERAIVRSQIPVGSVEARQE